MASSTIDPFVSSNSKNVYLATDQIQTFYTNTTNGNKIMHEDKPKIVLMGLKRSGKSSIAQVVFNKTTPNDILMLESTSKIGTTDIETNCFLHYQLVEIPGQTDIFESDIPYDHHGLFVNCDALIFIIDCSDHYNNALQYLNKIVFAAHKINCKIRFEVFIHKTDVLRQEGEKLAIRRDIFSRVTRELQESELESLKVHFHLTSIYDYSIFEAMSVVVQKLIPELPTLELMLNHLNLRCNIEKSYLFDLYSKIYISTDSSPLDVELYALVSDMIDAILDISNIYSSEIHFPNITNNQSSVVYLDNKYVLFLKSINNYLSLVCIMNGEDINEACGLLEHNFKVFKKQLEMVFKLRKKKVLEK